jgi:hypothetical protein
MITKRRRRIRTVEKETRKVVTVDSGGRNSYNGQKRLQRSKTAVFGSGPILGLIPLVV